MEPDLGFLAAEYTAAASRATRPADALVVFGITGDLARRMTLPALYRLTEQGLRTGR